MSSYNKQRLHKVGYFAELISGNEEYRLCQAAVEAEPGDDQSIAEDWTMRWSVLWSAIRCWPSG